MKDIHKKTNIPIFTFSKQGFLIIADASNVFLHLQCMLAETWENSTFYYKNSSLIGEDDSLYSYYILGFHSIF